MLSNCQVRRATIDDVAVLRQLWQQARWPAAELEKRLTEFQVVETAAGEVLGAIGLKIDQLHGQIHHEAYQKPGLAEELRPRLWDRLQSVARNYGLTRLWIENGSAMFWLEAGFEQAGTDLTRELPASFIDQAGPYWLTLKLREDPSTALSLDNELELFRQSQREQSERVIQQARALRMLAGIVVALVLILIGWAGWTVLRRVKRRPEL